MKSKVLIGPAIIVLGLFMFLSAHATTTKVYHKYGLAETVAYSTGLNVSNSSVELLSESEFRVDVSKLISSGLLPKRGRYRPVEHRQTLCIFGVTAPCKDLPGGWAVYQDKYKPNSYISFDYGHKLTLTGCKPSVGLIAKVDFRNPL